MSGLFDKLWYRWTTWWNPYGDLVTWIGPCDDVDQFYRRLGDTEFLTRLNNSQVSVSPHAEGLVRCKGMVRREDSLLFMNTLSCHKCFEHEAELWPQRGYIRDVYFSGQGIGDRTMYDKLGRHL